VALRLGEIVRMSQSVPVPRLAVTEAQIRAVVADFYAAVRQHPALGPVFAAHVTDWTAHEAKIVRFWSNAIGLNKTYDGNPLAVHKAAGNVRPGMFIPWLRLFDTVLQRDLPTETAEAWSALAHRIGDSLAIGLMAQRVGPPDLKAPL
jgi:hemoglobin